MNDITVVVSVLFLALGLFSHYIYYRLVLKKRHELDLKRIESDSDGIKKVMNLISRGLLENTVDLSFFYYLGKYNILPYINRGFHLNFKLTRGEIDILEAAFSEVFSDKNINWNDFTMKVDGRGCYLIDGFMENNKLFLSNPNSGERIVMLDISYNIRLENMIEILSKKHVFDHALQK